MTKMQIIRPKAKNEYLGEKGEEIEEPRFMKNGLACLFARSAFIAALIWGVSARAACYPAPSGLISWWRADGGGGDAIGNNNGTVPNGVSFASGLVGDAFSFSNLNQVVQVPSSQSLNQTNAITLEGWVMVTANPTTDASIIVGKDDLASGRQYELDVVNTGSQLVLRVSVGVPAGFVTYTGTNAIPLNTWAHVAITYDGSHISLYVNANLDGSIAATGPIVTGGAPLTIGGLTSGPWSFFGRVDELSFYNRALSSDEIVGIYTAGTAGKCAPACAPASLGLVGWWPADGNPNDIGGQDNGTLVNGVGFAAGKVGQAFTFNGVNQFVRVPDAVALDPTDALTLEAWVYVSAFPAGDIVTIIGKEDPYGVHQYQLTLWNTSGRWCFRPTIVVGGVAAYFPGNTSVQTGQWYHIATTYDGAVVKLYVNGVLDGSAAASGAVATTTQPVRIGGDEFGWFFNGLVDETSLYNRALSDSEILAIYAAGSAGKCTTPVPPLITQQPTDQAVFIGQNATFSVVATGSQPLSYQWLYANQPITGATVASLTLTNVQSQQAGSYSVQVTNLYGAVLSSNVVLTVSPEPPAILLQPTNLVAFIGQNATFTVVAAGTAPLSYQWIYGGVAISGATNSSLSLTNLQSDQAGSYSVEVTNIAGSVTSSNAVLTVDALPVCAPLSAGMIGWWPGQGNANDVVGQNNGSLVNGAGFTVGMVGQTFSFDGVSQFVRIGDAPALNPTDALTLEAWVYVNSYPAGDIVTIVGKEDPSGIHQYQLTLWNTLGRWCFRPTIVAGGVAAYFPGATAVQTGRWYHIATTYDGATVRLYVNGALDGSVAAHGAVAVSTAPLRIGGDETGWFFPGLVDETSLYNRALASVEIQAIYAAQSAGKCIGATSPVIYEQPASEAVTQGKNAAFQVLAVGTQPLGYQWSFGGSPIVGATTSSLVVTNVQASQAGLYSVQITNFVGATLSSNAVLTVNPPPPCVAAPSGLVAWWPAEGDASDAAGSNSGAVLNGAGFASGYVGEAFSFTNANQVVQIPDAPSLNPTNAITIEGWVFVTAYPSVDASVIVGKDNLGSGRQYELDVYHSGNGLVFLPNIGVQSGFVNLTGTNVISLYTWTHVAMTYDGSFLRLYVNGVLDSSKAVTGPLTTGPAPLTIGGLGSGSWSFSGLVDELSLYSRALSGTEIQQVYAADNSGKCPAPVPPMISTQPASQTVTVGQNVVLNVLAGGMRPLSYQWSFDGQSISGATASSLVLTNVQRTQAGLYSVTITNDMGAATSSNAVLTVNFPPASIQVGSTSTAADGSVTMPILLVANGNENALGFSLDFSSALLTCTGAILGPDASGASLVINTNQMGNGQLGIALSLPTGSTFAAGTQQVLQVSFMTAVLTNSTLANLGFGDQPTRRQLSDPQAVSLAVTFTGSTLTIPASDFEGDVTPRPDGDKAVTITDWVLVGRYAARLDYPTNASEYQRADCAPRSTLGDGAITVADWVQAGRYAAGLDPATRAGGPTNDLVGPLVSAGSESKTDSGSWLHQSKGLGPRQIRLANVFLAPGQAGIVSVVLEAQGNENAIGFSLVFDPTVFTYASATLGANAIGATIDINASQASAGKLAFVLALPIGTSFSAGTKEIVQLNLSPAPGALGDYSLVFTDQPVIRQVVDPTATPLTTQFVNGTLVVNPQPTLSILNTQKTVTLFWPLWATNFTLQEAEGALLQSTSWTNVPAAFGVSNSEAVVTLPVDGTTKFYRLKK